VVFLSSAFLPQANALNGSLLVGQRTKLERDAEQALTVRTINLISLGIDQEFEKYPVRWDLEYSSHLIQTGNSTMSVDRDVKSYALGVDVFAESFYFVGVGVGFEQESIETRLYGISSHEVGQNNYFVYLATGIFYQIKPLFMSLEVRAYGYEHLDPNPSPSLLWKLGVVY
jgi:hypothetical protein